MISFLKRLFRRRFKPITVESVITALLLAKFGDITPEEESIIAGWTLEQKRQAVEWAWTEHVHASDNPEVYRLPEPAHVTALWNRGKRDWEGCLIGQ